MKAETTSPPKAGLARRLLGFARPYRGWLLLALFLILVLSGLINFLPVLIKRITDGCLLNRELTTAERLHALTRLSAAYLSLAIGGYLLRYVQGMLTAWLGSVSSMTSASPCFER